MGNALKFPIFKHNVVTGLPLNKAGITILRDPWPIGEGWYTLIMDFYINLTHGTGTTPKSEGELRIIRDVMLKTDRDDIIFKAAGRALFRRANMMMGTTPYKDAIAASTAIYKVTIPFHFFNRTSRRGEDTILNTARYRNIELHVSMGDETDLLGTVGTDTCVLTMDISVEKSQFALDETNSPIMLPYVMGIPPYDPNNQQFIDIEKNPDMALQRILAFTGNTDVVAGRPWSGTAADNIIALVTLYDNIISPFRNINFNVIQRDNKTKFSFESVITGLAILDFIEDSSVLSGYATGDKSVLQFQWTNNTPAGAQVNLLLDGMKRMK